MKIAVIIPSHAEALFNKSCTKTFGGGDVQMYQIAKELERCDGIHSFALIEDYERIDFSEADQFKLAKTYRATDSILVKFWKYHKVLQAIRPAAIVQHGLTFSSSLLALYCRVFRIRYVYMFAHDNEVEGCYQESGKKNPIFGMLLRYAAELITQSHHQRDELLRRYGKTSHVLKNGFYLKPARKEPGAYVLWVARHSNWKRPELFIQLAERNPDIPFKMVCPRSKAGDYEALQARTLKVANLEFVEYVSFDRIDDVFASARVFVNTSDFEGFPQTFIQAAMNGVPILSLNVDPDNILAENDCGFCCGGSMEMLGEKLRKLMADDELYRELSQNAFQYAQNNHDIRKNVKELIALINKS